MTLSKSSFGKYLIYAVGEIVLVVIGILIALYLNNKKEVSDRQEKQRNHLTLIKEELESNLLVIEEENRELSNIVENIKDLLNLSSSNISLIDHEDIKLSELLFLPLTRGIEIDYENGAFNEFTASGSLKEIKNDSLRALLRSWNRKIETVKHQEDVVHKSLYKSNDYFENNGFLKTIFDDINLSQTFLEINNSTARNSNMHVLKSKEFENILLHYLGVATQLNKRNYPQFTEDIHLLIDLINNELKN